MPGPNDVVVLPYDFKGRIINTITHSSNSDTVLNIQSYQPLVISGGSITVTSNASVLGNFANFSISNGATLGADGVGTTFSTGGAVTAEDANFSVTGGASVTLSGLNNFTKECYGANWTVSGSNSVLNLPALTNITGQPCNFPTIQAEAGGQILAPNLVSIQAGPLAFQADGTNSLINLSGLTNCSGQGTYLVSFEVSSGGTVQIPQLSGGPLLGVTLNPGGTIPTTQLRMLNTLNLVSATNSFGVLTNLVNLTVSGEIISFPALNNFDDGNINLSGQAVVSLPALKNYNKFCNGANWTVTGTGSVLNLPALTNITGRRAIIRSSRPRLAGILLLFISSAFRPGRWLFKRMVRGSTINFSALTNCSGVNGYLLTFEASSGGSIEMSGMTGGPLVGLTLNSGGNIPTSQIITLNSLTLSGVSASFNALTTLVNLSDSSGLIVFPALTNFDDGNVNVSGGASVSMPAVRNFTKLSCSGANWTVTGPNSKLTLGLLTNIQGQTCSFPVIQAEAGGQIFIQNVASIQLGPLAFQADGANSLINLSGLRNSAGQDGYLLTFEASNGGTILASNMPGGPLVGVTLNPGGTLATAQIQTLNTLNLPGVTNKFQFFGESGEFNHQRGADEFSGPDQFRRRKPHRQRRGGRDHAGALQLHEAVVRRRQLDRNGCRQHFESAGIDQHRRADVQFPGDPGRIRRRNINDKPWKHRPGPADFPSRRRRQLD